LAGGGLLLEKKRPSRHVVGVEDSATRRSATDGIMAASRRVGKLERNTVTAASNRTTLR